MQFRIQPECPFLANKFSSIFPKILITNMYRICHLNFNHIRHREPSIYGFDVDVVAQYGLFAVWFVSEIRKLKDTINHTGSSHKFWLYASFSLRISLTNHTALAIEETVLSDDIDIEAVNGWFPMSDVIEIQVTDAI